MLKISCYLSSRFRIVLLTLVRAVQNIIIVVGCIAFLIFICANIGLKSFKGVLSKYCRLNAEIDILPSHLVPTRRDYFIYHNKPVSCQQTNQCPPNYMCLREIERDMLYFTFDNIFYSSLNVLRVIILDDFEDVYEKLLDKNSSVVIISFFLPIIFFGSLILYSTLLNVVITTSYDLELKIETDIINKTGLYAKAIKLNLNRCSQKFVFVFLIGGKVTFARFAQETDEHMIDMWKKIYWKTQGDVNANKRRTSNRLVERIRKSIGISLLTEDKESNISLKLPEDVYKNEKSTKSKISEEIRNLIGIEQGGRLFDCDRRGSFFTHYWVPPLSMLNINKEDEIVSVDHFWDKYRNRKSSLTYRDSFKRLVNHELFNIFINISILLNVVIICTNHYPESSWVENIQMYSDWVFNLIFTAEYVFKKLAGQRAVGLLDVTELLLNILGWIKFFTYFQFKDQHFGLEITSILNVIMSLKMLRVVRLPIIKKLTMKLGDFMITILVYFVILFLLLYIWSIIGYQIFAEYYKILDHLQNPFLDNTRAIMINIMILCGQIYRPIQQCLAETEAPASLCMAYFLGGVPIFSVMIFLFEGVLFHSMATTIKINQPLIPYKKLLVYFNKYKLLITRWIKNKSFGTMQINIFVENLPYEFLIICITLSSSAILLYDDMYLINSRYRYIILQISEILVFIQIFCEIYMLINMNGWNNLSLNFTLKMFLILTMIITNINITKSFHRQKFMRFVMFLRILTLLKYYNQTNIIVITFVKTMNALFNSFILCFIIWLIFASVGVSLLKGMSYECLKNGREVNLNRTICISKGFVWKRRYTNFDNIFLSLDSLKYLTLYQDIEGIVLAGIRSKGVEMGIKGEPRLTVTIYFMLFIIGGSYFLFSLFIGVIFDTLKEMENEKQQNISQILNPHFNINWLVKLYTVFNKSLVQLITKPADDILKVFYQINLSQEYTNYCYIVVILNAVVMSFDSFELTEQGEDILKGADLIFFTLFFMEFIVKILGQRLSYFYQMSNILNFLAILLMFIELITSNKLTSPYIYHLLLIGRLIQAIRVFEMFPKVYRILNVILLALPSMFTIIIIHFLLIMLYACIGMFYFHDDLSQTIIYNHHLNFKTITHSISVLIILTTRTRVHDIENSLIDKGNEDKELNLIAPLITEKPVKHGYSFYLNRHHNLSPKAISLFINTFMLFNLIASMLYQAIMAEHFGYANEENEETFEIKDDILDQFLIIWGNLSDGSPYLSISYLSEFLSILPNPVKIVKPNERIISALNIDIYEGNVVACDDIFLAVLQYYLIGLDDMDDQSCIYLRKMNTKFLGKFEEFYMIKIPKSKIYSSSALLCAVLTIQRNWRNHMKRKVLL
ncbi:unnamed protein product [Gordionus sp. m RMFG-2023]